MGKLGDTAGEFLPGEGAAAHNRGADDRMSTSIPPGRTGGAHHGVRREALFRSRMERARSAAFVCDLAGRQTYANRACYELFGYDYSRQELERRPLADLWPAEDIPLLVRTVLAQALNGEWHGRVRQQRRDGTLFDAHITAMVLCGDQGQRSGVGFVIRRLSPLEPRAGEVIAAGVRPGEPLATRNDIPAGRDRRATHGLLGWIAYQWPWASLALPTLALLVGTLLVGWSLNAAARLRVLAAAGLPTPTPDFAPAAVEITPPAEETATATREPSLAPGVLTVSVETGDTTAAPATPRPTATFTPSPTPTPSPLPTVVPAPFPTLSPEQIARISTTRPIPPPVQPVPVAGDAINIVVLGSDRRKDWTEWHTDAIHVVSIQPSAHSVSIISIPRDLYVFIPGFWMNRINFADFYGEANGYPGGGPGLVRDTLLYNLGIRIDYYVRTDFAGLVGIVDVLGGVDVPVHCRLSDYGPLPDAYGQYHILTIEPGLYHFDGETALWYARSRRTTDVFSRERRQQQVLQAIWRRARRSTTLAQVPALWRQIQDMIVTDLPVAKMFELAPLAFQIGEEDIRFYNIGRGQVTPWVTPFGGNVFLPNWEAIQPLVAEAMAPPPEGRANRRYLPVEIWNGTSNPGWEWLAADRVVRGGFPAVVGSADRQDYGHTQLVVFAKQAKGSGVEILQQAFGLPDDRLVYLPEERDQVGFRLIVGADYQPCTGP
jgi:LCP family protein required for cell wall assembly/PAS domain S-box-containing protein